MNIKEIFKNKKTDANTDTTSVGAKNDTNANNATVVGASIARPSSKARPHTKTTLITLPILLLLIATLIAIGITNAAGNTAEPETDQTFTEDGDGYYIWVRAVDHAGNKSEWSEAQRIWIDNKGPSAPTITGGGSSYALSRTISVVTEADDSGASGVAYYEYLKKSGSTKPDTTAAGTKVTTSATSQKFDTNTAGDYVFFRAVDVVGNPGAWSDGQQVYIDVNEPTITVQQATLTIKQGQSYAFSNYFTVDANGTNTSVTTTYKVGSTAYTNTSTLAVGTHTVTCTAAKTGGNTSTATMTVVVKSAGLPDAVAAIQSKTTEYEDANGNTFVVPGGFKVRKDLAETVDKGIVIEDSSGNQFVWVPIGEVTKSDGSIVNIKFGRYLSDWSPEAEPKQYAEDYASEVILASYYYEEATYREGHNNVRQEKGNATSKDLASFINTSLINGGYYIARYEASLSSGSINHDNYTTDLIPAFKVSNGFRVDNTYQPPTTAGMLWNVVHQPAAANACRNLYAGNEFDGQNFVESDLMNSYAWDTALMYIHNCSGTSNYGLIKNSGQSSGLADTGTRNDVKCNIFDMKGNLREYTTESSSYLPTTGIYQPVTLRGAYYDLTTYMAVNRVYANQTNNYEHEGFRAVLTVF